MRVTRRDLSNEIHNPRKMLLLRKLFGRTRNSIELGYFSAERLTTLLTRYPTGCCLAPAHTLLALDANPRTWTTRSYHEIRARATILVCGQRRAEHTE